MIDLKQCKLCCLKIIKERNLVDLDICVSIRSRIYVYLYKSQFILILVVVCLEFLGKKLK